MARPSINTNLMYASRRARLAQQREPYWHVIKEGQHLGYRKLGPQQGTWVVRYYAPGKQRRFETLGVADDTVSADDNNVLSYADALKLADDAIGRMSNDDGAGIRVRRYTVAHAATDWLDKFTGSLRSKQTSEANIRNYILPILGGFDVRKLNSTQIENWLHNVAQQKPIKVQQREAATKKLPPSRRSKIDYDGDDPETIRKRRDTANRVFNDLRTILNRAANKQKGMDSSVWNSVARFENVGSAKNEYLTLDEAQRFLDVCPPDFRDLVQAALVTGCRYGELCTMKVSAYDLQLHAISVMQNKTGRIKHVFLTPDEATLFQRFVAGKKADDLMLYRTDGKGWAKSHQQPRMREILKAAKIDRHVRFHDLRHTFATLLVMNGTSIQLVANQLGHSGTRIAEKHYAHFSPAYVASTIRENKPSYGFGTG